MRQVLVKVYAAFCPAGPKSALALRVACAGAVGEGQEDGDWLALDGDMLRLGFEGLYFPLEEALEALLATLPPQAEGKLDYLDLEAWTLSRCLFERGAFKRSTRDLNQVLDYSGH